MKESPTHTTRSRLDEQALDPTGDDAVLRLNPLLSVSDFDVSGSVKQVLCELPDESGKMYRFTLPAKLFDLVRQFDGRASVAIIKKKLLSDDLGFDADAFDGLVRQYLLPKHILVGVAAGRLPTTPLQSRPHYMQAKLTLLSPVIVNAVARRFSWLYSPACAIVMIFLSIAAQLYFYVVVEARSPSGASGISAENIIIGLSIVLGGLFVHEFGHATAAYRAGCRQVEIGVGWYICFVVFYAELSEAWKLRRSKRVIIDCGGMYFQLLYTSILVGIYVAAPYPAVFYAILLMNFAFIWNLNPFLRLDGYWLASDLLGIPNLRREAARAVTDIWRRWRNHGALPHPAYQGPGGSSTRLLLYAVSSNLFFIWMAYLLGRRVLWDSVTLLAAKWEAISRMPNESSVSDVIVTAGGLVWRVVILAGTAYFVIRIAMRIYSVAKSARRA